MNPGKLRERGQILRLNGENTLEWQTLCDVWLKGQETGRRNLFSTLGIGAAGAEFLLRERDLTLHDAILYRGQHYFLTEIGREGIHPIYYKVQAARITPQTVTVWRDQVSKGEYGRPLREPEVIGSFPGLITEKYLGSVEETMHIESEERLIVVAPKAAIYQTGDHFEIGENRYRVMVAHPFEDFKNEYEVKRVVDD